MRSLLLALIFTLPASAQVVVCASPLQTGATAGRPGDGYRECRVGISGRIKMVMELSDGLCFEGISWGAREQGVVWVDRGCRASFTIDKVQDERPKPNVKTANCEAKESGRTVCEGDTKFGVALVKRLGAGECEIGKNWDFDEKGVWVSDGCHAQFAFGGFRLPPNAVPATATRIICESSAEGEKKCETNAARGVGLIRQTSTTDCILNRTWGYDDRGIWVRSGCGAEFAVAAAKP